MGGHLKSLLVLRLWDSVVSKTVSAGNDDGGDGDEDGEVVVMRMMMVLMKTVMGMMVVEW